MERSVLEGKGDNSQQIRPSANFRRWDAGQTLRSSLATCETNPTTAPLQHAFPSSQAGPDKVARAIQRGVEDPYLALHIGRGGTVQFRGEEASRSRAFTATSPESSPAIGVLAN